MARESWKTIASVSRIEYEVKKSVFIASCAPVTSGEEAVAFLRAVKKEYPDARHHVYAYRVGGETIEQRYSDDGEPQGTGGMPVLEVIKHQELDDVICVVTRYFGGILLGTGGLTRAYSTAAAMGIEKAKPCRMEMRELFHVKVDYSLSEKLQYAASKKGYIIGEIIYEDKPVIPISCRKEEKEDFLSFLNDATSARAEINYIGRERVRVLETTLENF